MELPMTRSIHLIAGLVLLFITGCSTSSGGTLPPAKRTFDGTSATLKKTVIVPALDTPIPLGKSAIWCGSFQMAWNQFKQDLTREPILLARGIATAKRLNDAPQSANDLPADSWYAAAGTGADGIVERIQREMAVRFPSVPTPQFTLPKGPYALAYAYLETAMRYGIPFLQNPDKLEFHGGDGEATAVESFGLPFKGEEHTHAMVDQVVLIYQRGGEFAINLSKNSKPFYAVVASMPRPSTLAEAIEHVQAQAALVAPRSVQQLNHEDHLLVPEMCWRLNHHFAELEGDGLLNKRFEGYLVQEASQMIEFRIDRYGVELKSEARFMTSKGPRPTPRSFVFDGPFLLYLTKLDAKWPFFVMWVDNAELLRRFGS
jgi:hypothetical protein